MWHSFVLYLIQAVQFSMAFFLQLIIFIARFINFLQNFNLRKSNLFIFFPGYILLFFYHFRVHHLTIIIINNNNNFFFNLMESFHLFNTNENISDCNSYHIVSCCWSFYCEIITSVFFEKTSYSLKTTSFFQN